MKNLILISALLSVFSVSAVASDLPACQGTNVSSYHKCFGFFNSLTGFNYIGEFQNGTLNGKGTQVFDNGNKYIGEFKDGYKNGQGTLTFPDGSKYVGQFKDNAQHGRGVFITTDGIKYIGEWNYGTVIRANTEQELKRQAELERQEELKRKEEKKRQAELKRKRELERQAEQKIKEEKRKQAELERKEEERKQAELKRKEEIRIKTEEAAIKEAARIIASTPIAAASGSAFAITKDGYLITNEHVVKGCDSVKVHNDGEIIPAKIITKDSVNDIALLKADFNPKNYFELSDKSPRLMQEIYVAGYPFSQLGKSVKVTKGIISSLTGISDNFSQIQIDAALQSGNSGGPIFTNNGEVVGVAVAKLDVELIYKELGSIPENTNFGIKTSVVRNLLDASEIELSRSFFKNVNENELSQLVTDSTFLVTCWMTIAQIEKMKSQRLLFNELN